MVYLRWNELRPQLGLTNDGIIVRADAERLVTLDVAVEAILGDARAHRLASNEEVERLRDAAKADAEAIKAHASEECRAAVETAVAQASAEALTVWQAKAAAAQREGHEIFVRYREMLAKVVVNTVRQLVHAAPASDFFEMALSALDREAEEARRMVLHVHPDDASEATQALAKFQARWPEGLVARVEVAPSLPLRSCRVETDLGYVDSSLEVQLAVFGNRLKDGALTGLPEFQS